MWPVRGEPSAVHTRNPPRWERTVGHLLTKSLLKFIDSLAFNDQRWKMEDGRRRPLLKGCNRVQTSRVSPSNKAATWLGHLLTHDPDF